MRNFYIENSSNRYAVDGDVTDWVDVPFNEANYGANYCGSIVCARTWLFVRDSINAWYTAQIAAGQTPAQIDAYLSQFDVWDRYDYDGDGNFDEPDGYIDHFQSVHAGEGEETGGGAQGSGRHLEPSLVRLLQHHRCDRPGVQPVGRPADRRQHYWVGDYTIEPENGGVGVFAHEFGHDLDLPDLYDSARRQLDRVLDDHVGRAPTATTARWTSVEAHAHGRLGEIPARMAELRGRAAGEKSEHKLGPAETNTKQAQGLFVLLPDKQVDDEPRRPVCRKPTSTTAAPATISTTRMYRALTLPAGAQLTAQVRYQIEIELGLRLRDRVDRRRADVDQRGHEPFDEHQPQRTELRQRHHGNQQRQLGHADRGSVRVYRQRHGRVPLLDGRRGGSAGLRG